MLRLLMTFGLILHFSCSGGSNGSGTPPAAPAPAPGLNDPSLSDVLTSRPDNPTCVAFPKPNDGTEVKLERGFSSKAFPELIAFVQAPTNKRFYAVRRTGQIHTFTKDDASDETMFLDLSGSINAGPGEAGLLGIAWHPTKKDEVFLSYTVASAESPANLRSVIARFRSGDGIKSENRPEIILTLEQPFENHNGGHISFGPDGFLYIAFGDGGSGGDPSNYAQNLEVLLGKILRLDVDSAAPYAVPSDNPFVNQGSKKAEIWAYGLRNPWRFQFDRATGDLWAADVGQSEWEEIDRIVKGGNYGWRVKEGINCYESQGCSLGTAIDPVATYGHSEGNSVTGGFVYRGKSIPSLAGTYLYGDFGTGKIWGLFPDSNGNLKPRVLLSPGFNISSFGEDLDGELYVIEYGNGFIHRLLPSTTDQIALAPAKLSQTGCVLANDPKTPIKGLIPYEVNSPLWSDGATKRRWMGLPNDKTIQVNDEGDFEFPNGTVLVKEFALKNSPIETRLFVRHGDGSWAGYSYAWNAEGTDADLVLNGLTKSYENQIWTYPSQAQCLQCHNSAAGFSLGLSVAQLQRNIGSQPTPQLTAYEKIGIFESALSTEISALPVPLETTDKAAAARSYLDANCANCHRPGGTGGGELDLRFNTSFKDSGLCNANPSNGDLGISEAKILAPGNPERSVLLQRMVRRGPQQMPPMASNLTDLNAIAMVESWIKDLKSCP